MPIKDVEARRKYQREWRQRRRDEFFATRACEVCGATEESAPLQLHHRYPAEKLSHKIWSWSAMRREAEIAKCQVLCDACHRDTHRHGTTIRYDGGCRCEKCQFAHWIIGFNRSRRAT